MINLKDKTILIGEDTVMNYFLLSKMLEKTGVNIIWAKNGKEVVEAVEKNNVDLVLMDIQMPEKDGMEAAQDIKKIKPDLPIIFQTAYKIDENIRPSEIFDDYILKPINKDILLKKVEALISH